jgi:hypothetical protein
MNSFLLARRSFRHVLTMATMLAALAAQQAPAGYAVARTTLPAGATAVQQTAAGLVYCTGTTLELQPPGQPATTLLALPGFVFGSFTLPVGASHVLFGESSNNQLWLVPLAGPAPSTPLATLPFNYDAVLLTPQRALVSAKVTGFATNDNDLVAVDLGTGALHTVAKVPGASGPLALASNGDVLYATSSLAFPTPSGTAQLLRFPRSVIDQAIATPTTLGPNSATVVVSGLDAAGDLAVDDDGDVFYADWLQDNVREIDDVDGPAPTLGGVLLDHAGVATSASGLQFVPGAGLGVFEPFQPVGGTLLVHETDFFSTTALATVATARAQLASTVASPVPAGPFALVASQGPANGIGLLAFGAGAPGPVLSIPLGGFEAPLLWDSSLVVGAALVPVAFDASGTMNLPLANPGMPVLAPSVVQVFFLDPMGRLGTTPSLAITLAP